MLGWHTYFTSGTSIFIVCHVAGPNIFTFRREPGTTSYLQQVCGRANMWGGTNIFTVCCVAGTTIFTVGVAGTVIFSVGVWQEQPYL
jgi:hypothetical protein